jgi:site-specific recombinase XerD
MSRLYERWTGYQSVVGAGIQKYIESKRALGRRFANEERALRLLDRFLAEESVASLGEITPPVVETFLRSRPRASGRSYNHLLGIVRRLLEWLVVQGVPGVVPYRGHPRRETGRRIPVIFTDAQVAEFLRAAARLRDGTRAPVRGPTYRMVFAILYGLGLRIGEVSRLEVGDVDLERGLLSVRRTKFGKDRLVPFGPRLADSLRSYLDRRRIMDISSGPDAPLFTFDGRSAVSTNSIRRVFQHLVRESGGLVSASGAPARVHDFRHTFAVSTLLHWYRQSAQPGDRLHHLSTFLGHVNVKATAVYLTITSELLEEANRRFGALASVTLGGTV